MHKVLDDGCLLLSLCLVDYHSGGLVLVLCWWLGGVGGCRVALIRHPSSNRAWGWGSRVMCRDDCRGLIGLSRRRGTRT